MDGVPRGFNMVELNEEPLDDLGLITISGTAPVETELHGIVRIQVEKVMEVKGKFL